MPSAAAKGQYYMARTRRHFQNLGYVVEPLQLLGWIKTATGLRPMKRDAFASDLLAVNATGVLFIQAKGGESRRDQRAAARAAFAKYPLGPGCQQLLVMWAPRARAPEIEVIATGPQPAQHAVLVPARRKPKVLPLFATGGR